MYKIYNMVYVFVCVILCFPLWTLQILAVLNYFDKAHKVTKNVTFQNF